MCSLPDEDFMSGNRWLYSTAEVAPKAQVAFKPENEELFMKPMLMITKISL